jgi:cell shape-determining protein MreC
MVDILRIAADEIARLREEQRSISTLLQKVESLEADNKRLCKERDTLLESEAWGVNCKPTPEANG